MNETIIEKLYRYIENPLFVWAFPKLTKTISLAIARIEWLERELKHRQGAITPEGICLNPLVHKELKHE